jgi:hypothetical protein
MVIVRSINLWQNVRILLHTIGCSWLIDAAQAGVKLGTRLHISNQEENGMPILNLTRRNALRLGASAAAMGMLRMPALAQEKSLRLGWFGSKARANRTMPAIDLYKSKHAGVSLAGETASYDDFWVLLATQTAGGNAPDVMSQDNAHLTEYARRGVLQPLDEYVGKGLDL